MVKFLKSEGINLIIGNHEHVIQGCDVSDIDKSRFAAYCLGNFLGIAGVTAEPYGKGAEFSAACHLYLEKNRIKKVSYSILKTILIKDTAEVAAVPMHSLIRDEKDHLKKNQLTNELFSAAKRFSGQDVKDKGVLAEYEYILS